MRKDFEQYFTKLQLDYNKMSKQLEKVEEEYKKGLLTEEQVTNFSKYFNMIKVNYDRTHYMRVLLHKPPKFIEAIMNKITSYKMLKELEKESFEGADEEAVLEENKEAFENIDTLMKENIE